MAIYFASSPSSSSVLLETTAFIYSLPQQQQPPHMFNTHTTCEHVNNETTYSRSFVVSRPSNCWMVAAALLELSCQILCHFNNKAKWQRERERQNEGVKVKGELSISMNRKK